jgi:hypothetical protein
MNDTAAPATPSKINQKKEGLFKPELPFFDQVQCYGTNFVPFQVDMG